MRTLVQAFWAGAVVLAPLAAFAAPPPARTVAPAPARPPIISSQQIDRYDAIDSLQKTLKEHPKSVADWVILGELAHEVAMDLPANQARTYFKMSREAFEKARDLAPNKPGLKAAVQFARDQEANGAQFEKARDQLTPTYLDARRRDLEASDYAPAVRVYSPPPLVPRPAPLETTVTAANTNGPATATPENAPQVTPVRPNSADADTANYGTQSLYSYPANYRSFAPTQTNVPYTYQQYSSAYYPPGYFTSALQPMTLQRYTLTAPTPALNPLERQLLNSAPPSPPR